MLDFEVQRCTRRCAKTERELRPGEPFFSVLVSEGSQVVRYDYCEEAWEAPPEGTIGFWKSQMPEPNATRINWAPNDVMLDYFQRLETDAAKQDVRYVLALLMIRRRVLRLEDTENVDPGGEVMVLYCSRNETEYKVAVVSPGQERIQEIQQELAQLLFADAASGH